MNNYLSHILGIHVYAIVFVYNARKKSGFLCCGQKRSVVVVVYWYHRRHRVNKIIDVNQQQKQASSNRTALHNQFLSLSTRAWLSRQTSRSVQTIPPPPSLTPADYIPRIFRPVPPAAGAAPPRPFHRPLFDLCLLIVAVKCQYLISGHHSERVVLGRWSSSRPRMSWELKVSIILGFELSTS